MATSDSLPLSTKETFCLVRKEWVALQKEERVRQRLLLWMTEKLGYPLAYLTVEKALSQIPHLALQGTKVPDRRADILCFAPAKEGMRPLLLIECKADVALSAAVERQVIGYNHYVAAPFIAIANESDVKTGWYDKAKKSYLFLPGLPSYSDLIKREW